MKLPQLAEELLQFAILDHLDRISPSIRSIERQLEMLGSEFSPYFHELNAKIDELSERIEHHEFDD